MSDILLDDADLADNSENIGRVSRPTLAQVEAIMVFMGKHPDLAHRRRTIGASMGQEKFHKLWAEISKIINSMNGAIKSTRGWIKFWSDKRRSLVIKKKQIAQGKLKSSLTLLEQRILDLCDEKPVACRKKRAVKQEPCNGEDDDSMEELSKDDEYNQIDSSRVVSTETEKRQLAMIDKLVDIMDQQSGALTQMAQASLTNAKALERIAEASHVQALAVNRLSGTFDSISASVHDVRNAILGIDYTMKRCYSTTPTQQPRQNNIFS